MNLEIALFWFRRDLRIDDNAALYAALKSGLPVLPIFIFDTEILDRLEDKNDRRVTFIYKSIQELQAEFHELGAPMEIRYGKPSEVFERLLETYNIRRVFTNHDYEPYAIERDTQIRELLKEKGIPFFTSKDHVVFENNEVIKDDGKPYTVFTPYSRKWKSELTDFYLKSYPVKKLFSQLFKAEPLPLIPLEKMGFEMVDMEFPGKVLDSDIVARYKDQRDIPGIDGTSRLGTHLRFGTISIRQLATEALKASEVYLNELIWRDFYQMILTHFPRVGRGEAFRKEYEMIQWRNNEDEFLRWTKGETGYPIVDAGMRQLNQTGFMHNRVRMVVASFLSKHLLIDWRWGEAYFASKLLDFDLASNNGGWQWAAGSGCDAAPYFRIFNPYLQTKKFDPEFKYIRKWVPEFESPTYSRPIVEHEFARKRCLEVYGQALRK